MKPSTQVPKAFSRPSIDLGKAKREWLNVRADTLRPGDTLPDVGLLDKVETSNSMVTLYGPLVVITAKPDDRLLAFVEATQVG